MSPTHAPEAAPVPITHYSDLLCIWAYVSQVRCDELEATYGDRVQIESRYIHVFGAVEKKLHTGWADRGGVAGYAAHVHHVAADFPHVELHPDVWVRDTPTSSLPGHEWLCAVRLLEAAGEAAPGAQGRMAWALRLAFFAECADISARAVLAAVAERCEVAPSRIEPLLASGAAQAALAADLEQAAQLGVRSSPTLLMNEARQCLVGNVGYRVIDANVRELLENPGVRHSWC